MFEPFNLKSTKHLIIEIKAKCEDQGKIRDLLKARQADFKGLDHQIDTYFKVNHGRLKLREGNIENYLIFYERANQKGPKQSESTLYEIAPGASLKDLLVKSLGVLAVVDKQREIYFINNVKFHLDQVQRLGAFVEIEAIDATGNIGLEKLREQCSYYLALFGIKDSDLLADSYSDQIIGPK